MFDFVQRNKTAASVLLGAVAVGLVVTGGITLSSMGGMPPLAKVGDSKITEVDLFRFTRGENLNDAERAEAMRQLIERRLMTEEMHHLGLAISDTDLARVIQQALDPEGKLSHADLTQRFKDVLEQRQQTAEQFDADMREQVLVGQLVMPVVATNIIADSTLDLLNRIMGETRYLSVAPLELSAFLPKVQLASDAARQYYDKHQNEFKLPETVTLEYIQLSADNVGGEISVSADEIKAYFEKHRSELVKEERRIRQIQLNVEANANAQQREAVRKQAQALQQQLKQNPASFAEVARQKSQDVLSAEQGGDLGYIGKGVMQLPAFDEAAFATPKGQVSGVVETPQGFAVLMVEDVRAATLESVQPQIESRLRAQKAKGILESRVQAINDALYQRGKDLKPIADQFKLTVQRSPKLGRKPVEGDLLANAKLLDVVFAPDALIKRNATELVELKPGLYVAARVVEHSKAQVAPFDAALQANIEQKLRIDAAMKLARQQAEDHVKALRAGQAPALTWGASAPLSRGVAEQTNQRLVEIFKVDAGKVPAYSVVELPGQGFAVVRIDKVEAAPPLVKEAREQLRAQLQELLVNREATAYMAALRTRMPVTQAAPAKPQQ